MPQTMQRPCKPFAFVNLRPAAQLALASRMTLNSLIDYAISCRDFSTYFTLNCREIVSCALKQRYGYICPFDRQYTQPIFPIFPTGSPEYQFMIDHPDLNYLLIEELNGRLQEHKRLVQILTEANGSDIRDDEAESVYGPGVRGLLRYLVKYHIIRRTTPSRHLRMQRMTEFLKERYTYTGIHEMAGVYECLSDIISQRLEKSPDDEEEVHSVCSYLIAQLEVLFIPEHGDTSKWLWQNETNRSEEELYILRRDHKSFFWEPAQEALHQVVNEGNALSGRRGSIHHAGDLPYARPKRNNSDASDISDSSDQTDLSVDDIEYGLRGLDLMPGTQLPIPVSIDLNLIRPGLLQVLTGTNFKGLDNFVGPVVPVRIVNCE
ncbi:hypothetical protein BZA77DRAFT_324540 [Pyronema omphalodes]|nr:hypothetical protein BZA77DRAFT_324540 [Pyronema omphalodes]